MKKPRTIKDLQNDPRVNEIHSELENGSYGEKSYWCYLNAGWQDASNPECHTIHEWKVKDVCDLVHNAIPFPNDPELNR